ncbi:glycosyltransferase [bacterium]|nr:glycosyltransferase [candidate division CSSED10-310 bacterium]
MKKLLIFGLCPLPFENTSKSYGPGIRVWQFIKPLIGMDVEIFLIANRIPYVYPADSAPEILYPEDRFMYYQVSDAVFHNRGRIQQIHDRFDPDAILALTIFGSPPLANLKTNAPVWIDLFGHVMAEAQAKSFRYQNDEYLGHFWKHEVAALELADMLSVVSRRQAYATVGELGILGRLTAATTGYDFCRVIPCAMDPEPLRHEEIVFRGNPVPESAFAVLWSGGFNTWTDIETLVDGLEMAMADSPDVWFVSTGGQIDGHDEKTYRDFLDRINRSAFSDRFVIRGWIPKSEVPNYYFEADLGIITDRYMIEGLLGSKNRILDWMRAGLPALAGELCELSVELSENGIGYTVPLQDPKTLSDRLLYLCAHREEVKETGRKAHLYGLENLSFQATTEPFRSWLQQPRKSPDHINGPGHRRSFHHSAHFSILQSRRILQNLTRYNQDLEAYIRKIEGEFSHLEGASLRQIQRFKPKNNPYPADLPALSDHCRVSVIIVTWNGMKYVPDCLKSVQNQDYPDLETIVVDNGSVDGTPDWIQSNYPGINLIRLKRNTGFARGINTGLSVAAGEIVLMLNQDTKAAPDWTRHMVNGLKDDPRIAIAGCKIFCPDGITLQHAGGILHRNGLTDHSGSGEKDAGQYDADRDCDYVTGAAFGIKKSLIERIGTFDPRFSPAYFEELDYCTRAIRHHYRVRYLFRPEIIHFESTSTGKFSSRFLYLYHRNRLKFIMKHYPFRYILGTFRRTEYEWIRTHHPSSHAVPLLRAYMTVLPLIFWVVIREFRRK